MAQYGLELEPDAIAGRVGFLTSTTMTTTTTTTVTTILAISISILLAAVIRLQAGSKASKNGKNGVPALPETIPYVSNTLLYTTDMKAFLSRAT
jgi:hypothetical protein